MLYIVNSLINHAFNKPSYSIFSIVLLSLKSLEENKMLIVRDAVHVWGQGIEGNSLFFLPNFIMNLKLL